jgi:hypothetical protein
MNPDKLLIPLSSRSSLFWTNTDVRMALPLAAFPKNHTVWIEYNNPTSFKRLFCDCSDDWGKDDIFRNLDAYKSNLSIPQNLRDLLNLFDESAFNLKDFSELGLDGKALFDWCVDFLLVKPDYLVSLHNFIRFFLEVPLKYDYILMNLLAQYKITSHGGGIRSSWFNEDCALYKERIVNDERKKIILNWINNF